MPQSTRRRTLRALALLLAALLLLAACSEVEWNPEPPVGGNLGIVEIYATGYAADGSDQYVRLFNPSAQPVELAGWSLGDEKSRALFPEGARIGPGQTYYAARTAQGFQRLMSIPPDSVWGETPRAGGPQPMTGAITMKLGRERGVLYLREPSGRVVDQVAWGGASAIGWVGVSAPAPPAGIVLDRGRDEAGWSGRGPGPYRPDTNTAADWKQGSDWLDRRPLRPGQTWFSYPTYTVRGLTAYASPDSTYQILTGLIDRARSEIDLNLYSFSNIALGAKLADAARRGVKVRLLMEGGTVGGLDDQVRYVAQLVHQAGGEVRWMINQPGSGMIGRYVYNHAKYGVIDGRTTFVQSENLGQNSAPVDPSTGNRGWGVVVEDQALADYFGRVFAADWNPGHGDTFPFKEGTNFGPPPPGFVPDTTIPTGDYPHPFPPLVVGDSVRVTPVLAPDHALLATKGISGLIRSARRSILVEQLYIQMHCAVFTTFYSPCGTRFLALARRSAVFRRFVLRRIHNSTSPPFGGGFFVRWMRSISLMGSREGVAPGRSCYPRLKKEGITVARKRKEYTVHVTHSYVHDPESVERGLQLWATYLAQHLIRRLSEEQQAKQDA